MKRKPKYDTPIRIICAVLFALFSFLYIYMFQGEQLALIQDHLAQGQTSNNTLLTAIIITLLLGGLQYLLNRVGRLHGRFEAMSYLPSCVLLALITKVDGYLSYSLGLWGVVLFVVAMVYTLIVWIDRNTLQLSDGKFLDLLTPNLRMMAILFLFTGYFGSNSPEKQFELAAWKHTHSGEYERVLEVGRKAADCNTDLAALRNLALAKTGQMGSKLFAYLQPYGSDGLLMNRYNVQAPSYGAKVFYEALGAQPYGGESAAAFYKRMSNKTDSAIYRDMYLGALLLDKNLADFAEQTAKGRDVKSLTAAPVHYQEAWMIYNEQHPFTPIPFTPDEVVAKRYNDYLALREANADDRIAMENCCRRKLGDTYWFYYDFVK